MNDKEKRLLLTVANELKNLQELALQVNALQRATVNMLVKKGFLDEGELRAESKKILDDIMFAVEHRN